MPTFKPAAFATKADYNFVSYYNLHKPNYDTMLHEVLGDQFLVSFLDYAGAKVSTSSSVYKWFEEDRIHPKIKATCSAGSAGASVTFTVVAASELGIAQNNSPYGGTANTKYKTPVRINDVIMIKPSSGTVTASSCIKAIVTAVTPGGTGATTFAATPLDSTDTIPAVSSDEIIIIGNAHGEGSSQPEGLEVGVLEKSNNVQIIKHTRKITGTEANQVLWFETTNQNGKKGYTWTLQGEKNAYKQFLAQREMALLLSEHMSNSTLSVAYADAGNPIALTEGLIPFCLGGNTTTYNSITGFTIADLESYVLTVDSEKGAKDNMFLSGINLSMQIDRELRDTFVNGAISYGEFNFGEAKNIDFQFQKMAIGGYSFVKKTYDVMNDYQFLGASGYGGKDEALIIPMDSQMTGGGKSQPSLCLRYMVDPTSGESREMKVAPVDLFKVGDSGQDMHEIRYISEVGFQGIGQKRFGYISKA